MSIAFEEDVLTHERRLEIEQALSYWDQAQRRTLEQEISRIERAHVQGHCCRKAPAMIADLLREVDRLHRLAAPAASDERRFHGHPD